MMTLASVAQEFDYPVLINDFDTSGYELWIWVAAIVISFVVGEVTEQVEPAILSFFASLLALYIALTAISYFISPSDQDQREANIVSVENNYDVEVIDMSESEETSQSGHYTIDFDAKSNSFGISECTQYLDMDRGKYSVYCQTDDVRAPLETLGSPN